MPLPLLRRGLPRVYTLSPAFRADRSDTAQHLAEFYMLEAELTPLLELDALLSLLQRLVQSLAAFALGTSASASASTSNSHSNSDSSPRSARALRAHRELLRVAHPFAGRPTDSERAAASDLLVRRDHFLSLSVLRLLNAHS